MLRHELKSITTRLICVTVKGTEVKVTTCALVVSSAQFKGRKSFDDVTKERAKTISFDGFAFTTVCCNITRTVVVSRIFPWELGTS